MVDTRAARALTILVDLWLPLKWAEKIKQALYMRAAHRLEVAAARIQKMARVFAAHNCTAVKRLARGRAVRAQLEQAASVIIQKRLARGPSTRAATALLATHAYRKYVVDHHEILQYAAEEETTVTPKWEGGTAVKQATALDPAHAPVGRAASSVGGECHDGA